MTKALLCKTHDKKSRFKYVVNYHYKLRDGIVVKLQKETSSFAKSAGWGLKAVTDIKKNTSLGAFRFKKKLADAPVDGLYCFPQGKKFKVSHPESLMNKINTIVDDNYSHKINCKITNARTVKTEKDVKAGQFLYAPYGSGIASKHKWDIQYSNCNARIQKGDKLRIGSVKEKHENDDCCACCNYAVIKKLTLYACDLCTNAICEECLGIKEKHLLPYTHFFCKSCLENPLKRPAYPNRYKKATRKPYFGTALEKTARWLENIHKDIYCTSANGGPNDLPTDWKFSRKGAIDIFQKADMGNVEFLNLKGGDANDKTPWNEEVSEALIQMLSREKSHVYGINLGEIYFTKEGIKYLYDNLPRTWIGFIFVEKSFNVFPNGWFRYTRSNSHLSKNRRERPMWYKKGEIAPWYDKEKRKFHEKKETMGKCFFSCLNSKNFGK